MLLQKAVMTPARKLMPRGLKSSALAAQRYYRRPCLSWKRTQAGTSQLRLRARMQALRPAKTLSKSRMKSTTTGAPEATVKCSPHSELAFELVDQFRLRTIKSAVVSDDQQGLRVVQPFQARTVAPLPCESRRLARSDPPRDETDAHSGCGNALKRLPLLLGFAHCDGGWAPDLRRRGGLRGASRGA